jgi:hypothetical protein
LYFVFYIDNFIINTALPSLQSGIWQAQAPTFYDPEGFTVTKLVLVIGKLLDAHRGDIDRQLNEKGVKALLIEQSSLKTLHDTANDAVELFSKDAAADSPADFYPKVFTQRTKYDLRKVVAVVIAEELEEEFYELRSNHVGLFGDYELPIFVVRMRLAPWLDEK